jgi:hypothetical protein
MSTSLAGRLGTQDETITDPTTAIFVTPTFDPLPPVLVKVRPSPKDAETADLRPPTRNRQEP